MGRMADARKRAQRKGGAPPPETPKATAPSPAPEREETAQEWVSREESLVFPSDAQGTEPEAPSRITLPASGLAEDILARVETKELAAAPPPAAPEASLAVSAAPRAAEAGQAHNISFFAAPAREEKKAAEATEHLATFFLAGEEYGIDVRLVQEIIRVAEITQVPRAPESIKGVINLRGRIIPVVDLKRKLNLGAVEVARQARIVVVKVRDRLIGLLVDGASQVLRVPVSTIEAAPEEVVEIDANYIRGVAKLEKRLIILVDLFKILGLELREGSAPPA